MDEAQRSELHALRRRAYGPDPDLDDAELARLRELEAGARDAARVGGAADPRTALAPDGPRGRHAAPVDALRTGSADIDATDTADDTEDEPPRRTPPLRPRTAILWAASVLVAVGATVAVSSALGTMTGREVGTVALDPDRAVPERWDDWYRDVATGVGEFHGLTVIGLENPDGGAACVTVVAPRSTRGGTPVGGCAAGSFPARGVLTVTDDMPAELRDEFPEGTALEFVLEGASVRFAAG
ncbi:hypothetical protein [Clavibacter sp. km1a]|uniref:hypothetical protein n=1 Tax=Clavibacter sp. km1a TaxID=3459136 RepID=UPI004041BB84